MIGGGVPKLVERALLEHGVSRIGMMPLAADFIRYYRKNLTTHTTLYDGAREVLERLQAQNKKLGLCTNKNQDLTIETLKQLDLARYFQSVVGERFGRARKPDPAPLRNVLAALGTPADRAVMVGDSAADVGCAKAAGIASIVVSFGYSRVRPEDLGGDAVIHRLQELPSCFDSMRAVSEREAAT